MGTLLKGVVKCLEPPCSREKKSGSKSSLLPEIEVHTIYYPLYAVTTACCVPRQIPVRNMKEHSREICSISDPLIFPNHVASFIMDYERDKEI